MAIQPIALSEFLGKNHEETHSQDLLLGIDFHHPLPNKNGRFMYICTSLTWLVLDVLQQRLSLAVKHFPET
jgi:hypothetical protein